MAQISRGNELALVESLEEMLEGWWQKASSDLESPPWIGERCFNLMARAAVNVLLAAKDNEEYMKSQGYVKD